MDSSPPHQQHYEEPHDMKYVDEDFFAALDQISNDNLKYCDKSVQKEIQELEKYHDVHSDFL